MYLSVRFRSLVWTASLLLMAAGALRAAPSAASDAKRDTSAILSGRATFQKFCAPCHGSDGKGNGAVASFLLKPPADLTQIRRRHNGVFPQDDLEAALLATRRSETTSIRMGEEILWGPIFLSLDETPITARTRVAELIAFLESVQEQ